MAGQIRGKENGEWLATRNVGQLRNSGAAMPSTNCWQGLAGKGIGSPGATLKKSCVLLGVLPLDKVLVRNVFGKIPVPVVGRTAKAGFLSFEFSSAVRPEASKSKREYERRPNTQLERGRRWRSREPVLIRMTACRIFGVHSEKHARRAHRGHGPIAHLTSPYDFGTNARAYSLPRSSGFTRLCPPSSVEAKNTCALGHSSKGLSRKPSQQLSRM